MKTCEPTAGQIQGVLGTSKRCPQLATLADPQAPGKVALMLGCECLVSYRREDLGTRNGLAGMLASAGVRQVDVGRVLCVAVRQVRRYAEKFEAEGLGAVAAGVPGHTHYFVCDRRGTPLLFDLDDESDDLRQVIPRQVRRVQALVGGDEKLAFVFDRGGYSHGLFASFEQELDAYYVAWEKHDRTDYAARGDIVWEPFDVELQGNHAHEPKIKHLWVAPCPRDVAVGAWGPKSPLRDHRKLLIRSEVKGRGGALRGHRIAPFLTNDQDSPAIAVARKLVGRWPQENEFKTLRHGYELDGITSYLTVPYAEAAASDPEAYARTAAREVANPRRKKLDAERLKLLRRIETHEKRLARLATKEKRSPGHSRLLVVQAGLARLRAGLDVLEARREAEPQTINQLRYLSEEGYERPDFASKLLVDILKVCARNARRQAEELLRRHYLNRRDPATLLRRMLHAGAHVRLDARGVLRVRLVPLNTAAENAVFERFIAEINARAPRTSGPAGYPIRFALAPRP